MAQDPAAIFQVLEVLGQGSYGTVRKCLDKRTGKTVAIKSIEKGDGDNIDTIMKEIRLLEKCTSPDIVSYYGCFDTPSELLIVMEYCAAGSVLDLMKVCNRKLTEDQVAAVLAYVLRGLVFLHGQKIIHRDLKAGNILLDEEGHAKLADFGVAIQLQSTFQKRVTMTGSPYWMAPDVIDQKDKGYTNKADIWSLAITAIELAEGEPPLYSVHFARVLFMIVRNPPPKLKNPENWSPEFSDFLAKCLQKDPTKRPSAEELTRHPFIERGRQRLAVLQELVHTCIPIIEAARIKHWQDQQSKAKEPTAGDSMTPLAPNTAGGTASTMVQRNGGTTDSMRPSDSPGAGSMVVKGTNPDAGSVVISENGSKASTASSSGSVVLHTGDTGAGSMVINPGTNPGLGGAFDPTAAAGSVQLNQSARLP